MNNDELTVQPLSLEEFPAGNNLLQTPFWGGFKSLFGWKPHPFLIHYGGKEFGLLLLSRSVGGSLPMAYAPHAPNITLPLEDHGFFLRRLSNALQGELPMGTLFIRYDLIWEKEASFKGGGRLKKSPSTIQPPDTVILNLDGDEDGILAKMSKKCRYNIRLARKKGVEIEVVHEYQLPKKLSEWHTLYQETASRDRIAIHSREYYSKLFATNNQNSSGVSLELLMAHHEGETLAGIITARCGDTATYLYGASSNSKRYLMPNHLLQWEAIQRSRDAGSLRYDLFGIPPDGENPNHPMHGLYRFKTGFGGEAIHRHGAWDYSFSRTVYPVFYCAESARNFYFKRLKKR